MFYFIANKLLSNKKKNSNHLSNEGVRRHDHGMLGKTAMWRGEAHFSKNLVATSKLQLPEWSQEPRDTLGTQK